MTEQRVSSRYAHAVLDAAKKENLLDKVYEDLSFVKDVMLKSDDLHIIMRSPVIHAWQKIKVLEEIFKDKVNILSYNFLVLVTEKQRESLILDIIEQYEKQYNKVKNRLPVVITTAFEMNSNNKEKVENRLHEITGKEILSEYNLDKDLKGGITVRIDDWVYDASVRHQLELLYSELAEGRKASVL